MKALPSIAFSGFNGSAGNVTAKVTKERQILSSRSQHSYVTTIAQAVSRNRLSKISRSYKQLSDSQMKGWETLVGYLKGISTFGKAAELTAHNAYVRINTNRILAGMPALKSAPIYTSDVPEVDYDDFWLSPERIVFVGLNTPLEHHRLVVKMSRSANGGVSSGWNDTVIITPALSPDWDEADVTQAYIDKIGFSPVSGQKCFISMWWMDTRTGFTGESMMVSAICGELSNVHKAEFVGRKRIRPSDIVPGGSASDVDVEFGSEAGVVSASVVLAGEKGSAVSKCSCIGVVDGIPAGDGYFLARSDAENGFKPQTFILWLRQGGKSTDLTFVHRGGAYRKPSFINGTSVFI